MATSDVQHLPGTLGPAEPFDLPAADAPVTNPYPQLAGLRQRPVVPADLGAMFGVDPGAGMAGLPSIFAVTTFDAVQEVLRDATRFSSAVYAGVTGPVMGRTILEMDPPEHQTHRAVLSQAFSRKAMRRWETDLVTPIVDGLIDQFAKDGRADLVRQLTFPFPVDVVAGLLGLPHEDLAQFRRWAADLVNVTADFDRAMAASTALRDHLVDLFEQRRQNPSDDLISVLAQAQHEGQRLTDEEILAFCRLLLPAGAETTFRSIGNLLYGLLTHPEQLEALRRDRTLLPQAIEEGLRWEPPLLTIVRMATRDTDVCGVAVPAGAVLIVHLGSANHDERRWERADEFDIFRPPQPHVAFGAGAHLCLGIHLARMESRVAVTRLLDRLPDIRLDPAAPAPAITGLAFRGPTALPVVFTPAALA